MLYFIKIDISFNSTWCRNTEQGSACRLKPRPFIFTSAVCSCWLTRPTITLRDLVKYLSEVPGSFSNLRLGTVVDPPYVVQDILFPLFLIIHIHQVIWEKKTEEGGGGVGGRWTSSFTIISFFSYLQYFWSRLETTLKRDVLVSLSAYFHTRG